ncbi:hypothetical protein D5F01_LYC23065 [Larimichthys crocea]|uniref:Ig-like domain-containing protein n=1 Tax=Larimichthys crocea TaxID=215358 RepID=A0A6G0HKH7_LARCR|nr:hypothetical protein D5F01_LYC23065 [Larimichthys crocea]
MEVTDLCIGLFVKVLVLLVAEDQYGYCAERIDGSVILESPAVPVLQGSGVTLHCRNKTTSSVHVADFYKDGTLKSTGYKGNISIHNVSKSDEGLYKCDIAGVGESTASWLAVRVMDVLMLLVEPVHPNHTQESGFAQIIPTRLQLFEYTFVSFNCEGLRAPSGWTVMRNTNSKVSECVSTWKTATGSICAIKPAYQTDSGEYWCEAGGERSNAVNITVTAGSVILESPAVPVTEGAAVTLRCRSKRISSTHIADFYKMDSSLDPASQERRSSSMFLNLTKDFTSAASLTLESQQRAGWLSESSTERPVPHLITQTLNVTLTSS